MTSAPTLRGISPADTDVRLDEQCFIDAVLTLQQTNRISTDAEVAWRQLLTIAYDLCYATLHDRRTGRDAPKHALATNFIQHVLGDETSTQATEYSVAHLHESLLERIPWYDSSGTLHAKAEDRKRRQNAGAFYTPMHVVDAMLDRALDPLLDRAEAEADPLHAILALRVCDPACGSGHFLAQAGERIARRAAEHVSPRDRSYVYAQVMRDCLHGAELDPLSAHVCRRRLWSLAGDAELSPSTFEQRIHVGHGLVGAPPGTGSHAECNAWCAGHLGHSALEMISPIHWHLIAEDGFDLVIGNPPFLNQLARDTSLDRPIAALLRDRFGDEAKGYVDTAALFLRLAVDLVRPSGRVALLQPWSMLAARDTGGIRKSLARRTRLTNLWIALEHIFDAGVHVCAPVLERTTQRTGMLHRSSGSDFAPAEPIELDMGHLIEEETWSPLVSDLVGIPRVSVTTARTVGDLAETTADFRDQYYGLRGCVSDALHHTPKQGHVRLITTGLVDPAACRWGQKSTKYDGRKWNRPVVDLDQVRSTTDLGPWTAQRLVPKLLLATQTKVLEVCVDPHGAFLPLTPLVTVQPHDAATLWHIAAAIASPVTTAIASARYLGTARSTEAIKLSASQTGALPLPDDGPHWDTAADAFQAASEAVDDQQRRTRLHDAALASCLAYGCDDTTTHELMAWWSQRLPH
ncbi:MAG: N-6 DNA methylase [Phycisphaerales bacterium]|nr:N-6 DNA methylase [Phycisphaerales bacterium]